MQILSLSHTMCVCVCIYIYIHVHTQMYPYIKYVCIYTYTHTHTCIDLHIFTLTHVARLENDAIYVYNTYIHTYIHTCKHPYIHKCIYTYIHTYQLWIATHCNAIDTCVQGFNKSGIKIRTAY